ncbi:MAG: hypothetical protein ABGX23_01170 [Nautiliaceae bacterium]
MGCGYKPSEVYQDKIIGKRVKTISKINPSSPREDIFFKDALNDSVYTILDKRLCFDSNCDTILEIISNSFHLTPIDYDENGFPIAYRADVVLKVKVVDKHKKVRFYSSSGSYDFKITDDSVITDEVKLNAIKEASVNALRELFAKITKDGIRYETKR